MLHYICALPNLKGSAPPLEFTNDDPALIDAWARRHDRKGWGVYDCHNPLKPGATKRNKETVAEVTNITIDIDFKDITETPAEVDARLGELLLSPNETRDSGHGRHTEYRLKEPISTDDAAMIARVDAVRARLIEILSADKKVSHHAALIRRPGTHNSKNEGEWLEVKVLSASGGAYDIVELEEMVALYDRPLLMRKPVTNGKGTDVSDDEPKAPIDAEQRLDAMRYKGQGDTAINTTWWDCMGSLLRRGMAVADVIDTLHAAAEANCQDDPNKAHWRKDLADMATRWLSYEAEFVHGLDANSYKQWQAAVAAGKKPRLVWSQNYGFHVRGMSQEPKQEKDESKKEEEPHKPHRGLAIFSSSAFTAGFIPPDYLIDGVVQRRFLYSFTGPTGHGKTAVLLLVAAHVGLGRPLGNHGIEPGSVLVLAGENPDDVRMRWIAMAEHLGFDPKSIPVHFLPGVFPMAMMRGAIEKYAQEQGCEFSLVIIDTSAAYFQGADENANVQLGAHAREMRTLVTLPGGPCVIVSCHPTKNFDIEALLPRGGGAFVNEVDGNLTCRKSGGDDVSEVHWYGKHRGPDFNPLAFELRPVTTAQLVDSKGRPIPTILAAHLDEPGHSGKRAESRAQEDTLLILLAGKEGMALAALAEQAGWISRLGEPNKSKAQRVMNRLKNDRLVKVERGDWQLTELGEKAAEKATARREKRAA